LSRIVKKRERRIAVATTAAVALQFVRESSRTKEANLEGRPVEMSESGHYLTARSLYDEKAFFLPSISRKTSSTVVSAVVSVNYR